MNSNLIIHPDFYYNQHGILVPKVNPEYPASQTKIEVPQRDDKPAVEKASKNHSKASRKKFKIKR